MELCPECQSTWPQHTLSCKRGRSQPIHKIVPGTPIHRSVPSEPLSSPAPGGPISQPGADPDPLRK